MEMPVLARRSLLGAAGVALSSGLAHAQGGFPDRPIRLIIPVPPGGITDALARAIGAAAGRHLRQPIVADNRPGAAGTLGPAQMARSAAPDGYTISTMNATVMRMPVLNRVEYDPMTDFTYIIRIAAFAYGVVVRADAPWRTWDEMIAYVRANPGKVSYGSFGIGGAAHVGMEQIAAHYGLNWVHIPYRGATENFTALLSGDIQIAADSSGFMPLVQAGRLRSLVVWSDERLRRLPDVPTLREVGMDLSITLPYGIAGPKGMPPAVVQILHDAFKAGIEDPAHMEVLDRFDMVPAYLNTADYTRYALAFSEEQKTLLPRLGISSN